MHTYLNTIIARAATFATAPAAEHASDIGCCCFGARYAARLVARAATDLVTPHPPIQSLLHAPARGPGGQGSGPGVTVVAGVPGTEYEGVGHAQIQGLHILLYALHACAAFM